jgi:hypothetical protein
LSYFPEELKKYKDLLSEEVLTFPTLTFIKFNCLPKGMQKKTRWILVALFALTLLVRLILAFHIPNLSYDSYFHLRQVEHITAEGTPLFNDELSYGGHDMRFLPAFHYFMAFFNLLLPLGFVAKVIPNVLMSLLPIIIFFISKKLTNNEVGSLLSATIASLLPILFITNSFTVETLFFPLLFLAIYAFLRLHEKKFLLMYLITFLLLSFTSSATVLLLIGFGIYLLLSVVEGKRVKLAEVELILFSTFFFLWLQFIFFKEVFLEQGLGFIWQNVPPQIITEYFHNIALLEAVVSVSVLPFVVGVYIVYRSLFQLKEQKSFLLISFVVSTTVLSWFKLIAFRHALAFFGLILAVLFASFYQEWYLFWQRSKFSQLQKPLLIGLTGILIISMLIPAFATAVSQNTPSDEEIEAFKWAQNEVPQDATVAALFEEGHLITYFSQRKNIIDDQFSFIEDVEKRFTDLNIIFTTQLQTQAFRALQSYQPVYLVYTESAQKKYGAGTVAYVSSECFTLIYKNVTKVYRVECTLGEAR